MPLIHVLNFAHSRLFSALLAAILGVVFFSGCTSLPPPEPNNPFQSGEIRVGTVANYPPLCYRSPEGIEGLEIDFARKFAQKMGWQVVIREYAWEDLIRAVESREIDVAMAGISITAPRGVRVTFTKPYMKIGQMALIRRRDAAKFQGPRAILLHTGPVGVEKGTTGAELARSQLRHAKVVEFTSPEKGAEALAQKEIDLFIHDDPLIFWLASTHQLQGLGAIRYSLSRENLAWAVNRSDPELEEALNNALENWQQTGQLQIMIRSRIPGWNP